jgi:hypothetical protein
VSQVIHLLPQSSATAAVEPEPQVAEEAVMPMRNRIENAIRRENDEDNTVAETEEESFSELDSMLEERREEQEYEDRENQQVSESPIERMRWSSTSTETTNYESE